jgi:hypothetical protein
MANLEKTSSVMHEHNEGYDCGQERGVQSQQYASKRKAERRLVLKQDLTMLPLLAVCFFFGYVVCQAVPSSID